MSVKDYRYHYLKVLPEENNQEVWDYIKKMAQVEEDEDKLGEQAIYSQLIYAVGNSNDAGGDSHDNPNLPNIIKQLSKVFPKYVFEYRWINLEHTSDYAYHAIYRNGIKISL